MLSRGNTFTPMAASITWSCRVTEWASLSKPNTLSAKKISERWRCARRVAKMCLRYRRILPCISPVRRSLPPPHPRWQRWTRASSPRPPLRSSRLYSREALHPWITSTAPGRQPGGTQSASLISSAWISPSLVWRTL